MNYGKNGISAKQKKINSTSKKLSTKLGITIIKILLVVILISGVFVGCAGLGMVKGILSTAPDISTIDLTPEGYATKFYNTEGEEIASLVMTGSNRISASIEEMPKHLIYAFVDIEDERFFDTEMAILKNILEIIAEESAAQLPVEQGFLYDCGSFTQAYQKYLQVKFWLRRNKYAPDCLGNCPDISIMARQIITKHTMLV